MYRERRQLSVTLFPGLDEAKHLEDEVGCSERGVAGGVVGRTDLHQVAAHDVEAGTAPDDLQSLYGGQTSDLRRSRAGTEPGVDGVNVEAEVDRAVPQLLPDLLHEGHEGVVPALLCLDHPPSLLFAPADIPVTPASPPQSYLHHPTVVQQFVLPGAPEGRTVSQPLPHHAGRGVAVGVHVDAGERAVVGRGRPQDGVGDQVVSAQAHGHTTRGEYFTENILKYFYGGEIFPALTLTCTGL